MLEPGADAVDERAVAERYEHRVQLLAFSQLDGHRRRAFRDRAEPTVLDVVLAALGRVLFGRVLRLVEVIALEDHRRT